VEENEIEGDRKGEKRDVGGEMGFGVIRRRRETWVRGRATEEKRRQERRPEVTLEDSGREGDQGRKKRGRKGDRGWSEGRESRTGEEGIAVSCCC
jgi:hypothetical protein